MVTVVATVRNGVVKVPRRARIRDGSKVVMAVVRDGRTAKEVVYPPEIEAEDVEFARACRARLAKQLRDEEA
ncbi:MAG TPA: hypothetical protein VNE39_29465 [Planctomycetota bacterium]|nr:hypothetical protein [Planctomycetota bacterium]